jgi:hypothetical protein
VVKPKWPNLRILIEEKLANKEQQVSLKPSNRI